MGIEGNIVFNNSYLEIGISKHSHFFHSRPIIRYAFRLYKLICQDNLGNNLNIFVFKIEFELLNEIQY